MTRLEYTWAEFETAYFHMSMNNHPYVRHMLIGPPNDDKILHRNLWSEDPAYIENIKSKLGISLDESEDDYNHFWFFELDGDTFYYSLHEMEGQSFGIYIKPRDTEHNYIFEPEEYENSDSHELGNKLIKFVRALNETLFVKS